MQRALEAATAAFSGETPTIHAAGRTDTGVHALGQVAHFEVERSWPARTIQEAMNFHLLAESVVVLGFVARRLYAERVVLLFAVREPAGELPALAGVPELVVGGLAEGAALELLASLVPGRLSPAVGAPTASRSPPRAPRGTG